jgi:hypothetical protein
LNEKAPYALLSNFPPTPYAVLSSFLLLSYSSMAKKKRERKGVDDRWLFADADCCGSRGQTVRRRLKELMSCD